MRVVHTEPFWRDFGDLSSIVQSQTEKAVRLLADNPYHPSLRTHKRRGESNVWQARVNRSYRILFKLEGETITLLRVTPHEK